MFKVKRIDNGELETVLAVDYHDVLHQTYFLTWSNNAWRWRPAHKYVPPNVSVESLGPVNLVTSIAKDTID